MTRLQGRDEYEEMAVESDITLHNVLLKRAYM